MSNVYRIYSEFRYDIQWGGNAQIRYLELVIMEEQCIEPAALLPYPIIRKSSEVNPGDKTCSCKGTSLLHPYSLP